MATILLKPLSRIAPSRLFSLWRGETFEEIRYGSVGKISQFTGIEIRTVTGAADLVPDVGLFWVDYFDHRSAAAWTLITVHGVTLFAYPCITDVDCRCRLLVSQNIDLAGIEPDAIADYATIDFGAFIVDLFHIRSAFRAAHGARPKDAGCMASTADCVSRLPRLFVAWFPTLSFGLVVMSVKQDNDDHRDNYCAEYCVGLDVAGFLGDRSIDF